MSDFVNYVIAALLCAFLFTDLRFDFDFSAPAAVGLIVLAFILLNVE